MKVWALLVYGCLVTLAQTQSVEDEEVEDSLEDEDLTELPESNVYRIPPPKGPEGMTASFEQLLDLYNPHLLSMSWNSTLTPGLNESCALDMTKFLQALNKGTLWALHMGDSSGRYNGGYFWGNAYWLGSSTHCYHLSPSPPFKVGFYVLKAFIELPSTLAVQPRSQLVGLCLPLSCSPEEAEQILRLSVRQTDQKGRSVSVSVVKTPHQYYYMTEDPVFWIITVATVVVFFMVAGATCLDLYQDWNSQKHKRSKYVFDNYSYQIANSQHHKDMTGGVKVQISSNNNDSPGASTPESSERTSVASAEGVNKRNPWKEAILAFSAKRNMLTICDKSVGEDTIPTIHGLRSISMAWVILGHTCIVAFKYSDNMSYRALVEKEFFFQTINNGPFSVDTFFFISGLLVSFLYFRTTAKHDVEKLTRTTGFTSNFLQFLGMIGYRFCRLTAPYFYVLGVVQVSMKWFHYNSVFEPPATDYINCPKYWWRNLLYINTLFPVQDMCMLWSWYLADDTQFYILGAVLLIMAVKHFKAAFSLMTVFLVSSWCTTAFIAYSNQHNPNADDPFALFDKIYDKPWTRLGPYLIGMAVGWILFKTDCKIKMKKATVALGWICSLSILLFLVYGLFGSRLNRISGAAFSSLSHTAWALALAWIVIACSTGHGGYVNNILSASILYPFSRTTYCAYLVHPIVIRITAMRMDSPLHLGPEMVAVMFIGQLVLSYVISFVVSLMFEAPIVSLLRLVSFTKRKSK